MRRRSPPLRARGAGLVFLLGVGLAPGVPTAGASEPLRVENPGLEGAGAAPPPGWDAEVGAQGGPGPAGSGAASRWRAEGGVFGLEGDADTRRWWLLSQVLPVRPGAVYRFGFEARSLGVDLARSEGFFPNCHVGVHFEDARARRIGMEVATVVRPEFEEEAVVARAPPGAARARLVLFLSVPGRLEVRRVRAERLDPAESYEVLTEHLGRHYPFLAPHGIDWPALVRRHAPPAAARADPEAFAAALDPLLAALEDLHVWIEPPGGPPRRPHAPAVAPGFDLDRVRAQVPDLAVVARDTLAGTTPEGHAYLVLGSLPAAPDDAAAVEAAFAARLTAPGLIVDLRPNRGGDEALAQRLAGRMAPGPLVYARARYRAGRDPTAFYEGPPRRIAPRAPGPRPPVAVLVGPGCVSSGEGFALALRALPQAALFGAPTRGASGNPRPIDLPNGVRVHASRWLSLSPAGALLERRGVPPTHPVAPAADRDAVLEAARAWLGRAGGPDRRPR